MSSGLALRSGVPGIRWPAIPVRADAQALAREWLREQSAFETRAALADDAALLASLQWQLERSEYAAPGQVQSLQLSQLEALLVHAWREVPFYRARLEAAGYRPEEPLTWARFRRIPVTRRSDVQAAGASVHARAWPPEHGGAFREGTSGSTAEPIRFAATAVVKLLWHAFTLREHLWHGRDFGGSLATIRSTIEPGDYPDWGLPATLLTATGPAFGLRVSTPLPEQLAWLDARDPDYLLSYPSNVAALAAECLARGQRLGRLREVRTMGERLPAHLRAICRRAWNAPVVDMYSAQEVGYIALQCPQFSHYHVMAEGVLVEILDEQGEPCRPGQVGRVVATSLHNFATPFIRYDLGDYAELGDGCPCGRTLPVLRAIMGRARNMARLPDGSVFWPRIRPERWADIAAVRQFRLVQTALDAMRLEIVTAQPPSAQQMDALAARVAAILDHPFRISIECVDRIARGAADKLDDFVCEVDGGCGHASPPRPHERER